MASRISFYTLPILLLSSGVMTPARADLTALTILTQPPYTGAGGQAVYGWQFRTTAPLVLNSIGLFDWSLTPGGDGFFESHPVGIWDVSKPSQLLVQALIPAGNESAREGNFVYVPVTSLRLESDHEYVIGALYKSSNLLKLDSTLNDSNGPLLLETGPGVQLEGYRSGLTTVLTFPSFYLPGDHNGIGPNFKYTVVPEPSTLGLLGLGGAVLLTMLRSRTQVGH